MTRNLGRRRLVVAFISGILAISALAGCGDDKPDTDKPGSAPQDTGG